MQIEIVAKKYNITGKLAELIEKKVGKLDKFFDRDVRAKVYLKQEKEINTMEITIYADRVIRTEVQSSDDMYSCIDLAMNKLTAQIKKNKTKLEHKIMKNLSSDVEFEGDEDDENIADVVKRKTYYLPPMSLEDAKLQLDLIGHTFYVFQNDESKQINVLYKRNDGNLGLIETLPD